MVVANFISPITLCLGTRVCSLSLSEVTNGCGSFQRDHIFIGNHGLAVCLVTSISGRSGICFAQLV